ncbi:hypothetical protein [Microbacter margulisiae]|uniref:hypothetical protein n=1 Tax=Microbacter margulisiae TaxID=1350067 RepID=UPI001C841B29|nr:hypothetical protein [Microbacter margulisiae]
MKRRQSRNKGLSIVSWQSFKTTQTNFYAICPLHFENVKLDKNFIPKPSSGKSQVKRI